MAKKGTSDAMEILYQMFVKDDPDMLFWIEKARRQSKIGHYLYWIRREKNITEKDFAEFLGISIESLRDIEEADYQGDDVESIYKIAFEKYGKLKKHKELSDTGWFSERSKNG